MITLRSKPHLGVFILSLVVYLFTAAGYVDTIDATPSIMTAKALLHFRTLSFKSDTSWPTVYSQMNGKPNTYVSKMGLALPTLYLVPVAIASFFSREKVSPDRLSEFLVSLVNSVLTAALLSLVFLIFQRLRFSRSQAGLLTLLLGFTTMLWPYAKTCHREISQALALVGLVWATLENRAAIAGLFFSIGVLTKIAWILPALPVLIWSMSFLRKPKNLLLVSLAGILVHFIHAWILWGSPFQTGYEVGTNSPTGRFWSTPFLTGLHAQFTSLNTGLLVFNPILFFFVPLILIRAFKRRFTSLDKVLLASIGLQLCFYARWLNPLGGHNLGPRYAVVILPLFFFLLSPRVFSILKNRVVLALFVVLATYSLLLQTVFVSVKAQQVHTLKLTEAPWFSEIKLFAHKLLNRPEIYNLKNYGGADQWVDLTAHRSLQGFNFWWAHLRRYLHGDREKNLNAQLSPSD